MPRWTRPHHGGCDAQAGDLKLDGVAALKMSPYWKQPFPSPPDTAAASHATAYATSAAAAPEPAPTAAPEPVPTASDEPQPHSKRYEPALRGSETDPAAMFRPRRKPSPEKRGLSQQEALAVGDYF